MDDDAGIIGLVGVGTMGLPMGLAWLDAGIRLLAWNRTAAKCLPLVERGATQAESIDDLCRRADIVALALLDAPAVDEALGRGTAAFHARVSGRIIVQLGTTAPEFSRALERDVVACGGQYAEAPVSGSRIQAEQGRLVGMVAGRTDAAAAALRLLEPLCRQVFACGPVPQALQMKLAINHYLIATATALAEAAHVADRAGLDLSLFRQILDAGPMASELSRSKLKKLADADFLPQAAIGDVSTIADLVVDQAALARTPAPLIAECAALFRAAAEAGHASQDMVAVVVAQARPPDAGGSSFPVALCAADVPSRSRPSAYPGSFASRIGVGRDKKALGDAFGLRNFGVNLTRLAPGGSSALKHAHLRQDEFVFVLEGSPTLLAGDESVVMQPGMCAGFRCGTGIAHHLANESEADVLYLEVGDRSHGDLATYPDEDLLAMAGARGWRFFHRDGRPY